MLGAAGFIIPEAFNKFGANCGPEAVWFKVCFLNFPFPNSSKNLSTLSLDLYSHKKGNSRKAEYTTKLHQ